MGKGGEQPLVLPTARKELLSGPSYAATKLGPNDTWIGTMDLAAFGKECEELGKELAKNQGPADVAHLQKIIWWSRLCQWVGLLLILTPAPRLIPALLLSTGTFTRWTIVGHHVCHGGFDKCGAGKYSRFKFGVGSLKRRALDWLDWMLVEAWNVEHNQLHHYHLGELDDPDLVEQNMDYLRSVKAPWGLKYVGLVLLASTWKWWYYSPNTYKHLKQRKGGVKKGADANRTAVFDFAWLLGGGDQTFFPSNEFLSQVLFPYFLQRFVLLPLPFLYAGLFFKAVTTLLLAEVLTNWHAFLCITTNHAGDDLYRFENHCRPRTPTFYLRQVISSANFHCGYDTIDFLQGFLNYQIEHHMWPDLSMLSYRKAQPKVKAICQKYGIPYVQHNVFWRLVKTIQIMTGPNEMRKFPSTFDRADDLTAKDD